MRLPAQGTYLVTVERIAGIMTGTIRYVLKHFAGSIQKRQNFHGQVLVRDPVAGTYVIRFAGLALEHNKDQRSAKIIGVYPFPYVTAVTVQRYFFLFNKIRNKE